ncbi:unnamed protein product [Fusarium langsethiae]|nr:unnamed protein product [Fusarium langsethiae]
MRQPLLFGLWTVGSLSSPCKPGRAVTHNNHDLPPVFSTHLTSTQPGQDTVVETHTTGASGGDDQDISVSSIHSTETFTKDSGSHTIKLLEGSVTFDTVSPPETRTGDADTPETSQASNIDDVAGSQTSNGVEFTDGGEATGVPINGPDTVSLSDSVAVTETVTDVSVETSDSGANTETSVME